MSDTSGDSILSVRDVVKTFGELKAVQDVSFEVRRGENVGFLGPNGAGKTTTLSMISGLLKPDRGEIKINGKTIASDTSPLKRTLGLVPQDLALYDDLSSWDNLRFFGALYDLAGVELQNAMEGALRFVGLLDRGKDKVKNYSGGMKRRLNLAAALLHDPEMFLLDEPTVGVDPQSRNSIFDNIALLRERGKTILYTTHYMEEVERLCDRVIIVDHGKVVADDSIRRLKEQAGSAETLVLELSEPLAQDMLEELRALPGVNAVSVSNGRLTVAMADLQATTARVLAHIAAGGGKWTHISSERPNLEAVFLTLTGSQLRDS